MRKTQKKAKTWKQAGAELCQAQSKVSVVLPTQKIQLLLECLIIHNVIATC